MDGAGRPAGSPSRSSGDPDEHGQRQRRDEAALPFGRWPWFGLRPSRPASRPRPGSGPARPKSPGARPATAASNRARRSRREEDGIQMDDGEIDDRLARLGVLQMRQVVNDVFTSGLTMFRSQFSAAIRYFQSQSCLGACGRERISATQYTFIVTTRPTSIAGQLSAATSLGAADQHRHRQGDLDHLPQQEPERRGARDSGKKTVRSDPARTPPRESPRPARRIRRTIPRFCLPVSPQAANATSEPRHDLTRDHPPRGDRGLPVRAAVAPLRRSAA